MGRWAQAKRRGGRLRVIGAPTAPPAPLLQIIANDVVQTATGDDDTGGGLELEVSPDGVTEWESWDVGVWTAAQTWGTVAAMQGFWYRGREYGNGVAYVGTSDWSAVLEVI